MKAAKVVPEAVDALSLPPSAPPIPPLPQVGTQDELQQLIELICQADARISELVGGQVDSVSTPAGDVVLLRRAQTDLKYAEFERHAAILSAIPTQIVLLDQHGTIVSVNAAWHSFAQANGYHDPQHGVGLNYIDVCLKADDPVAAQVAAGVGAVLAGERNGDGTRCRFALEYECSSPTEQRWFLLRVAAIEGAGYGAVVMHTDITERKLAAAALATLSRQTEQRERMLNAALDSISDYAYIVDPDHRFVHVNEPLLRLWRQPSMEAVRGKRRTDLGYEPSHAAWMESQTALVVERRGSISAEMEYLDPSGRRGHYEYRLSPVLNADGIVEFVVGGSRDISDRKASERQLSDLNASLESRVRQRTAELTLARMEAEAANAAKSTFLATMSHEIRTPLSGLMSLLELMSAGSLDPEQRDTLQIARHSGQSLQRIIDDILDFSKIEAGSLDLHSAPASLREVIDNVCDLHRQVASSKNVALVCSIADEIAPSHELDRVRLGQILNNLIGNAIKFTLDGTVRLDVTRSSVQGSRETVVFRIRDTGIGMTPQQLAGLFQPFTQASPSIATRFGGTGLGLVISRQLCSLMGGTMEVRSELGRGTEIELTVDFPISSAAVPTEVFSMQDQSLNAMLSARRSAPDVATAREEGSLLLIVDDHPINRIILKRQVEMLGYAVVVAAGGAEALAKYRAGAFGAVITDCNMPEMDGYRLTREIRRCEREQQRRRIPIIGCTANAMASAVEDCMEAGMDDIMVKPVGLEEIGSRLDIWLPLTSSSATPAPAFQETAPAELGAVRGGNPRGLADTALIDAISKAGEIQGQGLIGEFRRINEKDRARLDAAVARSDFPKVIEIAHRVKGASLMIGAELLADACAKLEASAVMKNQPAILVALQLLDAEFLRLDQFLDSYYLKKA